MSARQDPIESWLRQHMQPVEVPPASVIWVAVRPRLSSAKRSALVLRIGFAPAMLLALSASLAAASPEVRAWLGQVAVSMGGAGGRIDSLYPEPPFTVLQPTALPPGWTLVANGYNP